MSTDETETRSSYERYTIVSTTTEHYYITQNGKVVRETVVKNGVTRVLDYIYDESGRPSSLIYTNGTAEPITYYYVLNLQGDVMQIVDASGSAVALYAYDPWGKIIGITNGDGTTANDTSIAKLNSLRYRGYCGDTETQWYYLQSRYYDPITRRFINADSLTSTGQGIVGTNMFAYCNNNPVAFSDEAGSIARPLTFSTAQSDVGGSPGNENVVVINIAADGWRESSQVMGDSFAQSIGNGSVRVVDVTASNFSTVWSGITESYVIIHTHGSPNGLFGENYTIITTKEAGVLPAKTNIRGLLITACSTGGNNNTGRNVAQTFSQKIRPTGLVVCSTTVVSGRDKYFTATNNGAWIIYRNEVFQNKRLPATISIEYAAETIFVK